ncbi:methylmalonyl-CoA mutase small subunit [Propionibacteriaceae bacterium G1746]|uniref:methylmalonyl-CoA mutase small subunit n=1 Tax=Aestuariimicrobium sp. G57 TaxID=3418485 RepID=UPI003C1551E9
MNADAAQTLLLAGDFPVPTDEQWQAEVLKVLNRGRPEGKQLTVDQALERLRTRTVDGLVIEPLYTREDGPEHLGAAGVDPYTRGSVIKDGDPVAWDVRAYHEDPDLAFTKQQLLADMERGATSLWLRVDPDAIPASALADELADIILDLAPVSVVSHTDQASAAQALYDVWRNSGRPLDKLVGNFGIDPFALAAHTDRPVDLSPAAEWVAKALAELPSARSMTVDVLAYHEAGAGDVDELAFAIATGIEYLRHLESAGIKATDAFGQICFRLAATTDQFLTIAKFRALRRLWARVGEVTGVDEFRRGALAHAVSSQRMLTRDDPYVNILRATTSTFAAAVGGADIITTLPFDTVVGLPSDFSRRLARNVQIVLSEESNIGRVNDPAGGSWYVESLTDQLARAAWERVQQIESDGGFGQAFASGAIAAAITATVEARSGLLATRKLPLTGVSMFPMRDEQPITARPRPTAPNAREQFPLRRDAEVFEGLRDRAAAAGTPKVFLAAIGTRRDFGGRLGFVENLESVAGFQIPTSEGTDPAAFAEQFAASGAKVAVLCSSTSVYGEQALPVATALKGAGAAKVYLAGRDKELGGQDFTGLVDGFVFDGMDVVAHLNEILDLAEAAA